MQIAQLQRVSLCYEYFIQKIHIIIVRDIKIITNRNYTHYFSNQKPRMIFKQLFSRIYGATPAIMKTHYSPYYIQICLRLNNNYYFQKRVICE